MLENLGFVTAVINALTGLLRLVTLIIEKTSRSSTKSDD